MRWVCAAWLLTAPAWAQPAATPGPPPLEAIAVVPGGTEVVVEGRHVDAVVAEARAAYNASEFQKAARLFQRAAQAAPARIELYRDLARARLWARDAPGAVLAYRLYLESAPGADDSEKVRAEMELARRQLPDPPPSAEIPAEAVRAVEAARTRALGGQFAGPDGALGALESALEAGYLGPNLADARRFVTTELTRQTEAAVDRWWRPQAQVELATLERLAAGWKAQRAQRPLTPEEARHEATAQALERLRRGDHAAAIEHLGPIAGADPRLRYGLALALAGAERLEEAADSATAAAAALDDPRPDLLLGLLRNRLGRDGSADLRRGLDLEDRP